MSINKTAEQLIELVKNALNGDKNKIDCSEIDWETLISMAVDQGVYGLVGFVIDLCDGVPEEIYFNFDNALKMNICRDVKRDILINALLESFESNGVDCMPLKGYILKNMYPSTEMRDMCDVDILIHTKDFEKANKLMQNNGFKFEVESLHEYKFSSNDKITVELHKSLVPPYNHILHSYYKDGWKFAVRQEGYKHIYGMKPEDFYIYELAHIAKHYLNGGIGIRHIADIYVLIKNSIGYDIDYIKEQLNKLQLEKFYNIITNLSKIWFGNGEYDNETKQMAQYIINGSLFGTEDRARSSYITRTSGTFGIAVIKRYFSYIFPKRIRMINRYPILRTKPILYPFIIVYRWFDVLINRREKFHGISYIADKDAAHDFEEHCKTMGISNKL